MELHEINKALDKDMTEQIIINNSGITSSDGDYLINVQEHDFVMGLHEKGIEARLWQFVNNTPTTELLQLKPIPSKIKVTKFNLFQKKYKILNYLFSTIKILSLFYRHRNYYIFLPGNLPFVAALILSTFKKRYSIYLRGQIWTERNGCESISYLKRRVLSKAVGVICTGEYLKSLALRCNKNTIAVKPMLKKDFYELSKKLKAKPITDNRLNFLFIGRLEKKKGILNLVEASKLLSDEGIEFNLIIVGAGPLSNQIKDESRKCKFIQYLGMITSTREMVSVYKMADVFVLPSESEGFPRVIYEAALNKNAIVVSDLKPIRYFFDNGNCLYLRKNDTGSIVAVLRNLIKDRSVVENLSEAAYKKVDSYFKQYENETHAQQLFKMMGLDQ